MPAVSELLGSQIPEKGERQYSKQELEEMIIDNQEARLVIDDLGHTFEMGTPSIDVENLPITERNAKDWKTALGYIVDYLTIGLTHDTFLHNEKERKPWLKKQPTALQNFLDNNRISPKALGFLKDGLRQLIQLLEHGTYSQSDQDKITSFINEADALCRSVEQFGRGRGQLFLPRERYKELFGISEEQLLKMIEKMELLESEGKVIVGVSKYDALPVETKVERVQDATKIAQDALALFGVQTQTIT